MGSDISRSTFDPRKHYSGVRQQQGRVSVDADWNEHVDIVSHRVATETADVIGQSGAPRDNAGFQIALLPEPLVLWAPNTAYAQGSQIIDSNLNIEVAISAGTSGPGPNPPAWQTTAGSIVSDGNTGLVWQFVPGDLSISPGRIYVDGILCELNPTPVAIDNFNGDGTGTPGTQVQVGSVVVDGSPLQVGEWVQISAEGPSVPTPLPVQILAVNANAGSLTFTATVSQFGSPSVNPQLQRAITYATQPDYPSPTLLTGAGPIIVYLDVWERVVTALEDPEIQEIALGGADTATRTQTIWQVKLADMSSVTTPVSCATPALLLSPWEQDIQPSGGQLTNGVLQSGSPSLCALTPNTGYTGLENQLYRVEIHQGGSPLSGPPTTIPTGTAYFKWSRDNGSLATLVTNISPSGSASQLTVLSTGRDDVLSFSPGNWIELTDDYLELSGESGELHQIAVGGVDPTNSIITLQDAVTADFLGRFSAPNSNYHPRIVRWDQGGTDGNVYQSDNSGNMTVWMNLNSGVGDQGIPIPPAGTTLVLENGITVSFSLNPNGGLFQTDDYWMFAARTADASIDTLTQAPPLGIHHHYSRLGIVNFSPSVTVSDCRQVFPPLAEPAVHVTQVGLTVGTPLPNDSTITVDQLGGGITVYVDTPLDQTSVTQTNSSSVNSAGAQATCFVTVGVPTPSSGTIMGFTPLVLPATVQLSTLGTQIQWATTSGAVTALNSQFSATCPNLLAYLTLKGDFIRSRDNPDVYLDGEAFGVPVPGDTSTTQLQLPSGDGRRGGDFQMWFWLAPTPIPPTVTLSPTTFTFGGPPAAPVPVGTSSGPVAASTLTNNTSNALTLSLVTTGPFSAVPSTSFTTPGPFPDLTPGDGSVPAGSSCNILITFNPTAPGTSTGSVAITSPGYSGPPLVISLTGIAVTLSLSASPLTGLNFGGLTVGQSQTLTVTLTNTGGGQVGITGITNTTPAFSSTNTCGTTISGVGYFGLLGPGASCTISVTFAPATAGSFADTLTITSNAAGSPLQIPLSGSSASAPVGTLTVSPPSLSFSELIGGGTSIQTRTLTLSNTGLGSLTVKGVSISGVDASTFSITSNLCGTLNPGQSCVITLHYAGAEGTHNAELIIQCTGSPSSTIMQLTGITSVFRPTGGGKDVSIDDASPRILQVEKVQQSVVPPSAQGKPAPESGTRSAFIRPEERSSGGSQAPPKAGQKPPNKDQKKE